MFALGVGGRRALVVRSMEDRRHRHTGFVVTLCGIAYLTEFFFLHASTAIGSTIAESRATKGKVGFGAWGCASVLFLVYVAFVLPLAVALELGWVMPAVVLVQMFRSAYHLGTGGEAQFNERVIVGFVLLFAPFLIGMIVAPLFGLLLGPIDVTVGQEDDLQGIVYYAIFFFALSGYFASPWYERWLARWQQRH